MITVKTTVTRPDANTPWYPFPQSLKDYITANYVNTGKSTGFSLRTIPDDPLKAEWTMTWVDPVYWDEYKADPVIQQGATERQNYHQTYGITENQVVTES